MKKICLLLLLHAAAQNSFAQAAPPKTAHGSLVNPRMDKQEIKGFTVILQPAIRHTYLFSIYQKGKLLHSMMRHPVLQSAEGLSSREDAFRAAGWVIAAYQKKGVFPDVMPPDIARQMQLLLPVSKQ